MRTTLCVQFGAFIATTRKRFEMIRRPKTRLLTSRIQQALIAAALAVPATAFAQSGTEQSADDSSTLEKIVVTGSLLKRAQIEGVSPVMVIDRVQMEQQGLRTVQDVLDGLAQNTGGSVDQGFTFGFTPGASGVDLRGFGAGRVLTLIDGRRQPIYPLAISGTDNFVDTGNIPTALIERIEVLTDGASALYGSDAVSGVINIITRRNIEGVDTRVRVGTTSDGGYDTREAEISAGANFGDNSHVQFFAQYSTNDALMAKDRDWAGSDLANPRGVYSSIGISRYIYDDNTGTLTTEAPTAEQCLAIGGVLRPDGICGYDRSVWRQLYPKNDRKSIGARVDHRFSDTLSFFLDTRHTTGRTNTQLEPVGYQATGLFGGGSDTPVFPNNGGLIETSPGVYVGYGRRLVEFGPRGSEIDANISSVTSGLQGTIGSMWDWEVAVGYNKQRVDTRSNNLIMSAFEAEIEAGLDLFEPIPQSVVDRVSYLAVTNAESVNKTANALVRGELPFALPGGNIGVAVAADFANERFFIQPDPISLNGDSADGGSAGAGSRDHSGIGFEAVLPVLEKLELNVAARYDHYDSGIGGAFSPRLAVAWRPMDNLMLRASAGKSFRAPDLQRMYGAQTRSYIDVIDTVRCVEAGGTYGDPTRPVCNTPVQSVSILNGANPNLKNEHGKNANFGIVWDPIDGLSLTADIYRIALKDIVASPSAQFIMNRCANSNELCDLITRGADGTLATGMIETTARNLSSQMVRGVDLGINYRLNTDNLGSFRFGTQLAYVDSLKTKFDAESEEQENIGFTTLPEWRATGTVDWNYGNFGSTMRVNYTSSLPGAFSSNEPLPSEKISRYVTVNLQVRYDAQEWGKFSLGANNLFNRKPPEDPTLLNWPWYGNAPSYANPFGREIYFEWAKSWQ
jgi:iron complex outermembrane receptor protein